MLDGYPDNVSNKSIKCAERHRRTKQHTVSEVIFEESMNSTVPHELFLLSDSNKQRLITMLTKKFEQNN